MPGVNQVLLNSALSRLKQAFVPSDAAMGQPPPDQGGGAPPPDQGAPSGLPPGPPPGAAPGPPPGVGPGAGGPPPGQGLAGDPMANITSAVAGAVQQAMQQVAPGGAGGAAKAPKADINTVATDVFQLKKLYLADAQARGLPLPPDILDGPNRDPATGMPSTAPTGGSDPAAAPMPAAGGQQAAIQPIGPMQPGLDHSQTKAATDRKMLLMKTASDLLRLHSLYLELELPLPTEKTANYPAVPGNTREGNAAVWGSPNGPGRSVPAAVSPVQQMQSQAEALTLRMLAHRDAAG